MNNIDIYLNNLTAKDEKQALLAASYLVDNADTELFKKLVEKTDYLFDFVRNNVCKRIEKVVNKHNYKNIISFFDIYSPYYDDLFASILAKHANEDLTDEIFELLEKGSTEQKTYAAKYFYYIPDTVALEPLSKYAFLDDESLSYNSAEALGQMQDDISFDIALCSLKSSDDFEKLKAVKFFNAYGRNYPINEIFEAMKTSKMPENIAGQIPYMFSLVELLNSEEYRNNTLCALDYILSGLGEILPLSDIFQFELFEVLDNLINSRVETHESGKVSEILLKAFSKFKLFTENEEYVFDEDKNTKNEVKEIYKLLNSQSNKFWEQQKNSIVKELKHPESGIILSVLPVITEFNITEAIPSLKEILVSGNDEIIICEILNSLKGLNALENSDIESISDKITNPNIKAIINNLEVK